MVWRGTTSLTTSKNHNWKKTRRLIHVIKHYFWSIKFVWHSTKTVPPCHFRIHDGLRPKVMGQLAAAASEADSFQAKQGTIWSFYISLTQSLHEFSGSVAHLLLQAACQSFTTFFQRKVFMYSRWTVSEIHSSRDRRSSQHDGYCVHWVVRLRETLRLPLMMGSEGVKRTQKKYDQLFNRVRSMFLFLSALGYLLEKCKVRFWKGEAKHSLQEALEGRK